MPEMQALSTSVQGKILSFHEAFPPSEMFPAQLQRAGTSLEQESTIAVVQATASPPKLRKKTHATAAD